MKRRISRLTAILPTLIGTSIVSFVTNEPAQSFGVTFEAPTTQSTTKTNTFVIDFDGSGTDEIEAGGDSVTNSGTTYTYSNSYGVNVADQYGAAGGTNKYIVNSPNPNSTYTISINQDQKYFGMWWSAGDSQNTLEFYDNGSLVFTFNTSDIISLIPTNSSINSLDGSTTYDTDDYYGNPTTNFSGQNSGEPYAFINFYAQGSEVYDRIDFSNPDNSGNFESDNHTFDDVARSFNPSVEVGVEGVPFEFSPSSGLLIFGGTFWGMRYVKKAQKLKQLNNC